MKRPYAFLTGLSLLSATFAYGQTLTQANSAPVPGDSFTVNRGGYVEPGPGGAGQTWDHADLVSTLSVAADYVTPASTGVAGSFPGATVAQAITGVPNSYAFYAASASALVQLGVRQGVNNTTVFYSNPETVLQYPCSLGSEWTDDFSSNYTTGGTPGVRTGVVTGEVDATGNVVLPFGTVANVVRVHINESMADEIDEMPMYEYTSDHYLYYKPGFHLPVLGIYRTVSSTFGSPTEVNYTQWADEADLSVQDLLANSICIELFPVPAQDVLTVIFSSAGGAVELDVFDLHGRSVLQDKRLAVAGVDQHKLAVDALPAGVYLLHMRAANGDRGVRRFVVQ